MKKLLSAFAVLLVATSMTYAAGYLNANDLEPQTLTESKTFEEVFTCNSNAEKPTLIETTDERTAPDEEIFNARIKLNGAGKANQFSITFPAKAGETVTVYLNSSSKTDERILQLVNATTAAVVSTIPAPPATAEMKAGMGTFQIAEDGTYTIQSAKSGIYIYAIRIE